MALNDRTVKINIALDYGGCKALKNAIRVQNLIVTEGLSYAQSIKRVHTAKSQPAKVES